MSSLRASRAARGWGLALGLSRMGLAPRSHYQCRLAGGGRELACRLGRPRLGQRGHEGDLQVAPMRRCFALSAPGRPSAIPHPRAVLERAQVGDASASFLGCWAPRVCPTRHLDRKLCTTRVPVRAPRNPSEERSAGNSRYSRALPPRRAGGGSLRGDPGALDWAQRRGGTTRKPPSWPRCLSRGRPRRQASSRPPPTRRH
jgi:hypothetical protein